MPDYKIIDMMSGNHVGNAEGATEKDAIRKWRKTEPLSYKDPHVVAVEKKAVADSSSRRARLHRALDAVLDRARAKDDGAAGPAAKCSSCGAWNSVANSAASPANQPWSCGNCGTKHKGTPLNK